MRANWENSSTRPFQRFDLPDDRRRAFLDERLRGFGRMREMAAQPLGAELDRRERVLDLVRQPTRDLAPGRDPLRTNQRRDVIEDHDHAIGRAVVAAQRRGHHRQVDFAPLEGDRDFLRTQVFAVAQRVVDGDGQRLELPRAEHGRRR